MGHISGFRDAIFPSASIPNLTLVANVGLVLYLFMIGMETDVSFLINHWRPASAVAIGGLALPFGLGCSLAWGLYQEFREDPGIVHIEFSTYMLFIGVAVAITVGATSHQAYIPDWLTDDLTRRFQYCAES